MPTKAQRVLTGIGAHVWAMEPGKAEVFRAFVQAVQNGSRLTRAEARAVFGAARKPTPVQSGSVAVLPLYGTIVPRANQLEAYSGGTSCEGFGNAFDAAVSSGDVSAIVIDVNSHGGDAQGASELAAKIRAARGIKPIYAVYNPHGHSAGFWIGCQGDEGRKYVTPSGLIGNIGVMAVHIDFAANDAANGVNVRIIRNSDSPFKGEGNAWEKASEDYLAHIQQTVDDFASLFLADVAAGCNVPLAKVKTDFGQGRSLTAKRAAAVGMADVVGTLEDVLADLGVAKRAVVRAAGQTRHLAGASPPPVALDAINWLADVKPLRITSGSVLVQVPMAAVRAAMKADSDDAPIDEQDEDGEDVDAEDAPDCPECDTPMEMEDGEWVCPECGETQDAAAPDQSAQANAPPGRKRAATTPNDQPTAGGAAGKARTHPPAQPAASAEGATTMAENQAPATGAQPEAKDVLEIFAIARSNGMPEQDAITLASATTTTAANYGTEILKWKAAQQAGAQVATPGSSVTMGADRAADRPFASIGEQMISIHQAAVTKNVTLDPRLKSLQSAASGGSTYIPSDGGWPLQPTFATDIMKHVWEDDEILKRCNVVPIGAESDAYVRFRLRQQSRKAGYRFGGVQVFRTKEANTVASTKPEWAADRLPLEKLMGIMYVTREQLRSAAQLSAEAQSLMPLALSFRQAYEVFYGTGAGEGYGFMNQADLLITVAAASGQAAGTFVVDNALAMLAALPSECYASSAFFIHRTVIPQMGKMTIGQYPVFLANGNVEGPFLGTLYGRPVIVSEFCKPLGSVGDAILADLSQYDIATGGETRQDVSVHVQFLTDQEVFRLAADTNGQPRWAEAVEDLHGTGKTSPFITLAAR